MKLPVLTNGGSLCNQCVALCCRYYAFQIDKPETKRDFEDMRWYLLHEDTSIFVEDGEWYIQVNRKCKELLPDNRCGIYEKRPTICREYTTDGCDWHSDVYDYELLFTEAEQLERYMHEYLREKRRKAAARRRRAAKTAARRKQGAATTVRAASGRSTGRRKTARSKAGTARRPVLRLLKSA